MLEADFIKLLDIQFYLFNYVTNYSVLYPYDGFYLFTFNADNLNDQLIVYIEDVDMSAFERNS